MAEHLPTADDGRTVDGAGRARDTRTADGAGLRGRAVVPGGTAGVSSAHPLATAAGISVLNEGGNAVDAAVAVSYALGVVEPHGSGIGGGGVMLLFDPAAKTEVVFDYRETAPWSKSEAAGPVAVPGFVRGLAEAHGAYGRLPLERVVAPAVALARDGFAINEVFAQRLADAPAEAVATCAPAFPGGIPLKAGDLLRQPELARTMECIAREGADWFYKGEMAEAVSAASGTVTTDDMARYEAAVRRPLAVQYDSYRLVTAPPPLGGISLIQALKLAEKLGVDDRREGNAEFYDVWARIMARCYSTRTLTLADPDFESVDGQGLVAEELLEAWAEDIRRGMDGERAPAPNGEGTTHFVVADREGAVASVTNTIGLFFGAGTYVGGFFLNGQVRNFSDDVRSPNRFAPGKRPASFVCPAVLAGPERTVAVGAAGGKRIPLTVASVVTEIVKQGGDLEDALARPRFYADENKQVKTEKPLPEETARALNEIGYHVEHEPYAMFYGGVQALVKDVATGQVTGAADPRRGGSWAVSGWEPEAAERTGSESE